MTYTVVQRDPNSWTEDSNRRVIAYQRVTDCGHAHKTIAAAVRCQNKLNNTFLGAKGKIENNQTERPVSEEQLQDAGYWA